MKNLNKLTLADLVSLYNNYILVEEIPAGSAFRILEVDEMEQVREEIDRRIHKLRILED